LCRIVFSGYFPFTGRIQSLRSICDPTGYGQIKRPGTDRLSVTCDQWSTDRQRYYHNGDDDNDDIVGR
jgi:hypothetical protein